MEEFIASDKNHDGDTAYYQSASHVRHETATHAERLGSAWTGAKIAGGIGLGLTALIGGIGISQAAQYAQAELPRALMIAGGMLAGTGAIAGAAGYIGYQTYQPDTGIKLVKGAVTEDSGVKTIYINGDSKKPVNLNEYAKNTVPEADRFGRRDYSEAWWNQPTAPAY